MLARIRILLINLLFSKPVNYARKMVYEIESFAGHRRQPVDLRGGRLRAVDVRLGGADPAPDSPRSPAAEDPAGFDAVSFFVNDGGGKIS